MLRKLILVPLLLALALPILLAACGDSDGGGASETPEEDTTPAATRPDTSGVGTLALGAAEAAVGDEVVVTGGGWGTETLSFYLLPEDAGTDAAQLVASGTVAKLGEATPDAEGAVEFRFTLEARYQPENGAALDIEAGQQYRISGFSTTLGTSTSPLTVR